MKHYYPIRTIVFLAGLFASFLATPAYSADETKEPEQHTRKFNGNECIFFSSVYDWRGLDDRSLVIWAPGKRVPYHVRLTMPLIGLRNAHTLAFVDADHDQRLCSSGRDAIAERETGPNFSSKIHSITRLEAGDLKYLEEKHKVNLTEKKKKDKPSEPTPAAAK